MSGNRKTERSEYFYAPRRTTLPKDVLEQLKTMSSRAVKLFLESNEILWSGVIYDESNGVLRIPEELVSLINHVGNFMDIRYNGKRMKCYYTINENEFILFSEENNLKLNLSKNWVEFLNRIKTCSELSEDILSK